MLTMNERMAIRANNHKIFFFVVDPIFIYMMNSKNLFNFTISAFFTSIYHPTFKHFFSYRSERHRIKFSWFFIPTHRTTILSIFARRIHEFSATCNTHVFKSPPIQTCLRFIIAFSRTIFCFFTPRRNMSEFCFTYFTFSFYLNTTAFIFTVSRTVFKSCKSVFRHVNFFFTKQTKNIGNFHYASY